MSESLPDEPIYREPGPGQYSTEEHLRAQQEQTDPRTGEPLHDVDHSPADVPTHLDTAEDDAAKVGTDDAETPPASKPAKHEDKS